MNTIAVQYLEKIPPQATQYQIIERLHQAFDILPISIICIGWDLPAQLEDAVAKETANHRALLYRWHPLLTSDAGFTLPVDWQPINSRCEPVPGFSGLPEFTFLCPNRNEVQEWIAERIEVAAKRGIYQGLFFDRLRYPSPTKNLEQYLACFCEHCIRIASESGVDLKAIRRQIELILADGSQARSFIQTLFSTSNYPLIESFFRFRLNCISRTVQHAAKLTRSYGMHVGLDCFSPTLTRMVGQDLTTLSKSCDWIKIMSYPRVYGPAGLPFELGALSNWLRLRYNINHTEAIHLVNEASGFSLTENGLDSNTISHEIQCGRNAGIDNLFAGVALVEVKGIHTSTDDQLKSDIRACQDVDGLVLSWDLWYIRLETLSTIHNLLEESH